jgi:signal peptidase I
VSSGEPQPAPEPAPGAAEAAEGPDRATRLRQRRSRTRKQTIEWVLLVGGALVLALVIKTFLVQAFYIPSESMVPTLRTNDRVLVNKLSYKLHHVHRGDIVVFSKPENEVSDIKDLVKRVIGLPNETIEAHDNHIYVNGKQLPEKYLPDGTITSDFEPVKIPKGRIWVMGDNRTRSEDSRVFGPIKESSIVGRVFIRIWPPNRLHFW